MGSGDHFDSLDSRPANHTNDTGTHCSVDDSADHSRHLDRVLGGHLATNFDNLPSVSKNFPAAVAPSSDTELSQNMVNDKEFFLVLQLVRHRLRLRHLAPKTILKGSRELIN